MIDSILDFVGFLIKLGLFIGLIWILAKLGVFSWINSIIQLIRQNRRTERQNQNRIAKINQFLKKQRIANDELL